MRTPKEREDAFRRDLAALLAKHKAELEITDDGKPYGLHSAEAQAQACAKQAEAQEVGAKRIATSQGGYAP